MIGRALLVVPVALLLSVQVVRNAGAEALSHLQPAQAAKIWASHPSVEISLGLARIGQAARERRPISPETFAMIEDAARKSPLSPEPFLVEGVQAQTAGRANDAGRAFRAAQWRDPRSLPAAYFLADYYFRNGRPLDGLLQTGVLARLSPGGAPAAAPFVAAYARNRANWPQIRALFKSQPGVQDSVLEALAADPGNAETIIALADADHRRPDSRWLPLLLYSMVAKGDYERARAIWATVSGVRNPGGGLLYDASFSSAVAPAPFNWTFAGSTLGLAEREPGNRLHVIYYGSDDGALASQLVLLGPGAYRLQMHVTGAPVHPEALSWSIRCDKSAQPFASAPIAEVARNGWVFEVPASCRAQWVELVARSGEVTQQSEVTIGGLRLSRAGQAA